MINGKNGEKLLTFLLGVLWFTDGILQLQPQMFTSAFIENILKPNLQNQPSTISNWISFGIHIFTLHMRIENTLFALIQLAIGLLLLLQVSEKWKRFALWISIPWAFVIWVFGEGLGNLFTGSASFYTGAPGSILLYLTLAIFLLFPKKLSLSYLPRAAGLSFFLGGLLQEFPMFWTKGMQSMLYQMSQSDMNGIIASPAKLISRIRVSTTIGNFVAIAILVILGILLLVKPMKVLGWITIIFLFFVWWISQDFGGILTFPFGTATDPNSAPLFMLFLLPLLLPLKSDQVERQ